MERTLHVSNIPGPILVVAPHPDDDILSSGGLIQIALRLHKPVYVLFITTGDANSQTVSDFLHKPLKPKFYRELGYVRHREAVRAERFLGVPEDHMFFLGFPDMGMYDIATDRKLSRVHRSTYTDLTKAAYSFSYRRNAPYTHGEVLRLIKAILRKVRPGTIIVNLGIDIHPDHLATRILMLQAIRQLGIHPRIYSYLIHYPNWPPALGPLRPPKGVHIPGATSLKLTKKEEKRTRIAYRFHRSQATLIPNNYNLIRGNELFWRTVFSTDKKGNNARHS